MTPDVLRHSTVLVSIALAKVEVHIFTYYNMYVQPG